MAVVQNLYQIIKLPASFIAENDCNVESYPLHKALKEGNVVSIGDNLVFQQIRYHYGDFRDHHETFNYITKLRNKVHFYKKQGKYKEAHILETRISNVLFVKDIVNVFVDKSKKDFKKFAVKGFTLNGVHYKYLCSGAGQIRRNTATFINSELRDEIVKTLNCGLDEKTSEFVLAKYSAYFALSFSSILWVRTPRVCVIKDYKKMLRDVPVDFITKDENGKSILEKREMDLELNCFDGQGLIDPTFALQWGEDMGLPFTPCSFVARSCFIKGNLVTFDFKEFARQNGIEYIYDKWGKEYRVEDIDVLLSESQFKTHKYYKSWDEYQSYAQAGNIHWGVARYNKRHDDDYVLVNYQYIQALSLNEQDIKELVKPTVDWIKKVCSGDTLSTLLYAFGPKSEEIDYQQMYGTAQTTAMKAIVKNVDFLKDSYVQKKIYKNITQTINNAKIGKIWVRGNYQFMIADPYAQAQFAFDMEPTGLLQKDEVYSKFWLDRWRVTPARDTGCVVDACRSPMIDMHEHNPMNVVVNNTDADYWYQYLPSGIIYNTYDTSCFRHSDSD